jgi:hypothetical protein
MVLSRKDEYQARADDCRRRAESANDSENKTEWLKLASSWQYLADATLKNI